MLFAKDTPGENIVVRGARIIDPVEGVDAVLDVRLDAGVIAALGQSLDTNSHRVIDGGEIRSRYRGAMADFLERCRSQARRAGLDYALFTTDTPPERALRQFLLRRQGR